MSNKLKQTLMVELSLAVMFVAITLLVAGHSLDYSRVMIAFLITARACYGLVRIVVKNAVGLLKVSPISYRLAQSVS